MALRALTAASFTAGASEAAVVDPPLALALPSLVLPIFSCTSTNSSPNSSATIALMYVRVPVPKSWLPTMATTAPSRAISSVTTHCGPPPPPHWPMPHPNPRLTAPGVAPALGLRRDQPITSAPLSSCRGWADLSWQLSLRNWTGSMPILSASSSISDSTANDACGKPGARMATAPSSFVWSGACSR